MDQIFPVTPSPNKANVDISPDERTIVAAQILASPKVVPVAMEPHEIDMDVNVGNTGMVMIDLAGGGKCKVLYDTRANWDAYPQMIARRGYIYVYSDYMKDDQGRYLAGIKVGDGRSYLIDMAFIDELYAAHIADKSIHVTPQEKAYWDDKVTAYMDKVQGETLVLSKDPEV